MEELLPVGSIVSTKNKKVLMIIGYAPNTPLGEKQYDYIASNINGISKLQKDLRFNKDYFYLNKSDIINVLYMGYFDDEFDLYELIYERMSEKISKLKKENECPNEDDIKKLYDDLIKEIKARGKR